MTCASSSLAGGDDSTEDSSESLMLWAAVGVVEVGWSRGGSPGCGCEVHGGWLEHHVENEAK